MFYTNCEFLDIFVILVVPLTNVTKATYIPATCSSVGSAQQYQGSLIAGTVLLSARSGGSAGADCSQALCARTQTCSKMARLLAPSRSPSCIAS